MRVLWLPRALRRLEQAHQYIAQDKPVAAIQMVRRIQQCAERLREFPEMGRVGSVAGTRELIIPGTAFILHYRIRVDRVEILTILHAARRWPKRA